MAVEDVFGRIIAHEVEGIMLHDQLANYFGFIGLCGFRAEQEYHYAKESLSYRKINRYFLEHYNRLVPEKEVSNTSVIPKGWYAYERKDVDATTRRNAVSDAYDLWVRWEKDTKTLYEKSAKDLYDAGYTASALVVGELVLDVDHELTTAEHERLMLSAVQYSAETITQMQVGLEKRYKKKVAKLSHDYDGND